MGSHPINLAFRFLLEISALVAVGRFGWGRFDGGLRWVAVVGLPVAFMALWVTFAVPDDPSRGGVPLVPVPGLVRLLLELGLFACAVWALQAAGHPALAAGLGASVLVHYGLWWDRIGWLLERSAPGR